MIKIEHLNFNYQNKLVFKDFNLNIKDKAITTIIGPNGCGKSTLIKILVGLLKYEGNVIVNGIEVKDNIREVRKVIGVVFENPDNQIVNEIVFDDIAYTLRNMGFDENEISNKVLNIADYLNITELLNISINLLNTNQKQLVCIASALVHNPKILILDEALSLLDPESKKMVLNILKDLKRKGLCIINISHDIEDTLISDEVIVLDNGNILLKGKKNKIYKNEKLLNSLGYDLPFMVELSNRLMFYGLIDHVIYDMKEMVDTLWK